MENNHTTLPAAVRDAVLVKSVPHESLGPEIRGYDFNSGINLSALLDSYLFTGFQATNFGLACEEINKMLAWRLSQEPIADDEDDEYRTEEKRASVKCKIYLAYTSNMVSSGLREVVRFLVQQKLVDVVVTTAGGIEEDFIKCMAATHLGDFGLSGPILRSKGLNRIGNLLVPNENYCKFEDWIMPILDTMLDEQKKKNIVWTPSSVIARLGKEIDHPDSIYYWAQKNKIPVFCPALTDGSLGDMLYFHSYRNPGLVVDLVQDIRAINSSAVFARKTGVIILGGGVVKHHVCNANLMRNGADYAVYVNTGQEFDGSDAGASPEEAKSWGKIKAQARPVKICGDATLIFPLLVAQTFAKYHAKEQQKK